MFYKPLFIWSYITYIHIQTKIWIKILKTKRLNKKHSFCNIFKMFTYSKWTTIILISQIGKPSHQLMLTMAILGNILNYLGIFFCMYIIGIHTKFYGNSSKIECFTGQKPRPPPAMALTVLNLAYFRSFMSYNVFFAKCVHLGCIK